MTVITPVFDSDGKEIIFWTASRGHHADVRAYFFHMHIYFFAQLNARTMYRSAVSYPDLCLLHPNTCGRRVPFSIPYSSFATASSQTRSLNESSVKSLPNTLGQVAQDVFKTTSQTSKLKQQPTIAVFAWFDN